MKLVFVYSYNFKPLQRPEGFENLPQQMKEAIEKAEKEKLRFIDIVSFDFDSFKDLSPIEIMALAKKINQNLKLNEYTGYHRFDKLFHTFVNESDLKQIKQRENFNLLCVLTLNQNKL